MLYIISPWHNWKFIFLIPLPISHTHHLLPLANRTVICFKFGLGFLFSFCLFRVTLLAYRSSQARGRIRAPAAVHSHSSSGSSHVCNLHHSSRQCRILNPLSEAKKLTQVLMDASQLITTEPQQELLIFKISHISKIIWYLFFSDSFHLPKCPQRLSMLLQMARIPSFR